MRGIQWHGAGDLRTTSLPEPEISSPDHAIVAVDYCGVCGTDFGEVRKGPVMIRSTPHPLTGECAPITLGHEFAGTIVATGSAVPLEVGTRVTVDPCWRCGQCYWCLRGDYHLCRLGGAIGLISHGALAPLVRVPAAGLVPLPDNVDTRIGALIEPLSVALHALERSNAQPGDSLGIIGFGPIGAAVLLVSKAMGFGRVWVVEPAPGRRALAESFGADVVVEPHPNLYRQIMADTSVGLDRVIECSGHPDALPSSIDMVRRGGRLVIAGICNSPVTLDLRRVVLLERDVVGTLGYRHDFAKVIALIAAGRLDPSPLITQIVPFDRAAAEILRQSNNPQPTELKTLVEVRGA